MGVDLVQAIVVSEDAGHEETVEAAAIASLIAYPVVRDALGGLATVEAREVWDRWLEGRASMSVRRIARRRFDRLTAHTQRLATVTVGTGRAAAYAPAFCAEHPWSLRRLHADGVDFPRATRLEARDRGAGLVVVYVDEALATGAAAAQAAHALWMSALAGGMVFEAGQFPQVDIRFVPATELLGRTRERGCCVRVEVPACTVTAVASQWPIVKAA